MALAPLFLFGPKFVFGTKEVYFGLIFGELGLVFYLSSPVAGKRR